MEAGTVVINSGPQKNEGSAPFISVTPSPLFIDRIHALNTFVLRMFVQFMGIGGMSGI